jgi:GDP-L-fucose synthase
LKKVLLLGATGFAGRNVARRLMKQPVELITSSLTSGYDLRVPDQAMALMRDAQPDIIINCSAHVGSLNYVTEKAADIILDNTRMILNMYEAVAKHCPAATIINPVANCAYPAKADVFREDEWWNGHLHRSVLSYGSTRRMLWSVGESFAMQHDTRSVYLLVPNMYGEFDSTNPDKAHALNALISRFVKAEHEKKNSIDVWGTGVAIREWLYADDFAAIITDIVQHPDKIGLAEPLNIAQNFGLSVKELVHIINQTFGGGFAVNWDHRMPDGAPRKVMDDTRFRKVFPNFTFTELQTGIEKTVNYYRSVLPY